MPEWDKLLRAARSGVLAVLCLASVASAYIGVAYWATHSWILGVVLSMAVPGFGMVSVLMAGAG